MGLHGPPTPTVITTGAWSARQGQSAPAHRHAAWKITYYRTGRITSVVDGKRYDIVPGTVLVLRPDQAHTEIAHTAYSNYTRSSTPNLTSRGRRTATVTTPTMSAGSPPPCSGRPRHRTFAARR